MDKRLNDKEFLTKLDNVMGEGVRLKAKRAGGKSASELLDEYYTSPAGQRELKAEAEKAEPLFTFDKKLAKNHASAKSL